MPNTIITVKTTDQRLTSRKSAAITPSTINEKDRSCRAIATTSKPARVFDWSRGIINEVLDMAGCVLPATGKCVLLNAHNQGDVANILGSASDFAFGNEEFDSNGTKESFDYLECLVTIDESEPAAWSKLKNGHADSFSVGYYVSEYVWIEPGKTAKINGKTYNGGTDGLQVSTKWHLHELSQVPIGADDLAKARAHAMQETNKHNGNDVATPAAESISKSNEKEVTIMPTEKNEKTETVDVKALTDKAMADAVAMERARVQEITEAAKAAGIDAAEMISKGITADEARKEIIKQMGSKNQPMGRVELVADAKDKFRAAAVAGLATAMGAKTANVAGQEVFSHSILRTAEECLNQAGINTRGMRRDEIATRALTTGDFAHIFGSAANQALGAAYKQGVDNFSAWVSEIEVPDLKSIEVANLGFGGDLDTIAEGQEVPLASPTDEGETYTPSTKAKRLVLTRKMLINDNLGAFQRLLNGWAMKAKTGLNKAVFSILNANAAMSDGVALFHADHDNLPTGAALSAAALAAAYGSFRSIPDPDGNAMNQAPAFLVTAADIEFTARQLCTSSTMPASTNGSANPFNGLLAPISDANLDATTWYLAGPRNASDTIQVAYLQGKREPELLESPVISSLGVEYVIVFDYGVKAISWRSMLKGK